MKALIIEDELYASKHLQQVLDDVGEITVIAVLESVAETLEWFEVNPQPDLVFMDVHLADGLAFEIFNHIRIRSPIIFTTAYDEYALKAFKVSSIDYLLKPIEPGDVRAALEKLKNLSSLENMQMAIKHLVDSFGKGPAYRTHFLLPSKGDKLIPVQVKDLAYFVIDASIVKGFTFEGDPLIFEYTLDELVKLLDPEHFFRANRQYIISRTAIKDIDLWFNNRLSINLKIAVPDKILVSKARIREFKDWFGH